ncbi:MAG TPA: enoyl-CoA hydratase-related protein [Capillimicrobium sp.]|nr:enoyl-CoA hydratase-related protein [Capillimicrobium sp.]
MPSLDRDGDVFVLNLGADENRFHPDRLSELSGLLDEVAAAEAPRALVTTATGKFFSNGLDLDWLGRHADRVDDYVASVHELFARVLAFPAPTVAAIQGHAFAAGAMLALAHDWRVMRADRGFFCLPEADIRIPFTPGMTALIMAKLPRAAQVDAMLGARRFGGDAAASAGIVAGAVAEHDVVPSALALAADQAPKDGATLAAIKQRMYAPALAALADREANRLGG